jgi:hypothetical protein
MRTDKLAIAYQAAFHLAAMLIWARQWHDCGSYRPKRVTKPENVGATTRHPQRRGSVQ